jgi:hypothetical protein
VERQEQEPRSNISRRKSLENVSEARQDQLLQEVNGSSEQIEHTTTLNILCNVDFFTRIVH